MSEALWFAGLAFANLWMAGSLGISSSVNNTEKGLLGGAAVGTGASALLGRGEPAAMVFGGVVRNAVGGIAGSNQENCPVATKACVECLQVCENRAEPISVNADFDTSVQWVNDDLNIGRKNPGLMGRVWLSSSASKKSVSADGPIRVEMYDANPAALGKPQLLSVWIFDSATLKTLRVGDCYPLFLPCDPEAAHVKNVKLDVMYTPRGERLAATFSTALNLRHAEAQIAQAGYTYAEAIAPGPIPAPLALKIEPATTNRATPVATIPAPYAVAVSQRPAASPAAAVHIEAIIAKVDPTAWGLLPMSGKGCANGGFEVLANREKMMQALHSLRTAGKVKILAEPRLLTVSGQIGSVLTGGDMPLFHPACEGPMRVSHKRFGTTCNILPVVQANGKIHLTVQVETSELAEGFITLLPKDIFVPGFNVAHFETTKTIKDGETLVITSESIRQKGSEHCIILLTARVIQPACSDTKPANTMTLTDIARLARRGISEDIILRQMELTGASFQLTVEDILSLHEQGVSENVIRVIQMRAIGAR